MKINENNSNYKHGGSRVRARRLIYDVYKIKQQCEVSNATSNIQLHHIDEDERNQKKKNLMILQRDLHTRLSMFNNYIHLKTKKDIKLYLSTFIQKEPALVINEIYPAIVGESSYMGQPCTIIRLTYCHNYCNYCDSKYTWRKGKVILITDIKKEADKYKHKMIMITGGSPCLQKHNLKKLIKILQNDYKIIIEVSGTLHIAWLRMKNVAIIKDIKCPGSGVQRRVIYSDIKLLRPKDNLKFVLSNRDDYNFAKKIVKKYPTKAQIYFQAVWGRLDINELTQWLLKDINLNINLGVQMHKFIWGNKRGV